MNEKVADALWAAAWTVIALPPHDYRYEHLGRTDGPDLRFIPLSDGTIVPEFKGALYFSPSREYD